MLRPEISLEGGRIIEESARIRDELLSVQLGVQAIAATRTAELLTGIRQKLGYEDVEPIDESGIINTRSAVRPMIAPGALAAVLPISFQSAETTRKGRQAAEDIFSHLDDRVLVATGFCSIDDPEEALEYAHDYVIPWREKYGQYLEVDQRGYFEKTRSPAKEISWKGFTYDPLLNGSHDINLGLVATRMTLCQITHMGAPMVMERLNANTPQYIDGLVTIDVVGARNATDQTSIERAAGTSSLAGIKNPLGGSIKAAVLAALSARLPHTFLGIGMSGWPMEISTTGNNTSHIILRGGEDGPNYSAEHIEEAKEQLRENGLTESIGVDFSHANSGKKATNQLIAARNVSEQVAEGEEAIVCIYMESNLVAGSQKLEKGQTKKKLRGVSITDEGLGPDQTEEVLDMMASAVSERRSLKAA
jgi:3-deoxy-7-phosphoheptulonate synthase